MTEQHQQTWTVNAIKDAVRATGSHWFDPDTMRFFGTRVKPRVYQGPGGVFFCTSDKTYNGGRAYTVRRFTPETADISTAGEVCGYHSLHDADAEAARLAFGASADPIQTTAEEFRPVSVLEQFTADIRTHGNGELSEASARTIARTLIQSAKYHHELMEDYCNGHDVYDADGEPLRPLRNRRALIEADARAAGCVRVIFSGDPRGCTVKLVFPDGYTNDFAKEGYCVPTEQ